MQSFLKGNKSEAFCITERIVLPKPLWSWIRKALNDLQALNQSQAGSGLWMLAVPKEDVGSRIHLMCNKEDNGWTGKCSGGRARGHWGKWARNSLPEGNIGIYLGNFPHSLKRETSQCLHCRTPTLLWTSGYSLPSFLPFSDGKCSAAFTTPKRRRGEVSLLVIGCRTNRIHITADRETHPAPGDPETWAVSSDWVAAGACCHGEEMHVLHLPREECDGDQRGWHGKDDPRYLLHPFYFLACLKSTSQLPQRLNGIM